MGVRFLKIAVVYFAVGVLLGLIMGIMQEICIRQNPINLLFTKAIFAPPLAFR